MKKKQKGMTLMEIIVSCAVYAMFALLIAETMTLVNSTMRATNQLNRRLSYEAKYADNMLTTEAGNPLARSDISYRIRYEGPSGSDPHAWNASTATRYVRVNPHAGGTSTNLYDRSDPRHLQTGFEYTAHYDDSGVVGTVYNHNVNYRFMTFTKVEAETGSWPGAEFEVIVRLVPYFSDEADETTNPGHDAAWKNTQIAHALTMLTKMDTIDIYDVTGAPLMSGESMHIGPTTGSYALCTDYITRVDNICQTLPAGTQNVSCGMKILVRGQQVGSSSTAIDNWTDFNATYYQYVKVGTSDANKTYYKRAVIEYNVNTWQFKMMDSFTQNQSYGYVDQQVVTDYMLNHP